MASSKSLLPRIRKIALALPEAEEIETWGHPTFRVASKIFAGFGDDDGRPSLGIKVGKPAMELFLKDPRFIRAPYVGQHGWVHLFLDKDVDWNEVANLIQDSYRQIAPRRLVKALPSP